MAAPFFSMRWAIYQQSCKQNYRDFFRNGSLSGLGELSQSPSMFECSGNESRPVERYERRPLSRGFVLSTKRYSSLTSPLRDRQEDIPILAKYFIRRFATETKKTFTEITADAEAKLVCYGLPGNVRELANVIERVVVLSDGPEIAGEDLPPRIADTETDGAADGFSYRRAVDSARADVIKKSPCIHPRKSRRRGKNPSAFTKLLS